MELVDALRGVYIHWDPPPMAQIRKCQWEFRNPVPELQTWWKRKEALSALVVEWKLPGFPPDAAPVLTTSVCSTLPALPNANHDICKKIGGRRKRDYHERLEGQREAEKLPNGGAGSPDGHSQTELPTAGNAKDARCSVSMSAYQNVQKEPCAVRDSNPHR